MTNWEVKYNILKNIFQKNGSINDIHQGDVIVLDGVEHKIGSFLSDQRKLYNKYLKIDDNKKDKKVLEHIRLLEELGIDWNPKETEWLNKYKLLVDYKNKYGDLNVPYTYVSDGEKLGVFVANQRSIYRKNKNKENIDDKLLEHFKLLEDLGIIWDIQELEWNIKYNALRDYYLKNGNLNIDNDIVIDCNGKDASLKAFIQSQRFLYRKYINGEIERDDDSRLVKHFHLLNNIGMNWDPINNEWMRKYNLLVEYKNKNGNINVPFGYMIDNVNLGSFLIDQREIYRKNKDTDDELLLERFRLLDNLGIIWEPIDDYWNKRFNLIIKYKDENGHCNIPNNYVCNVDGEEIQLGKFLSKQRELYKKHKKNSFNNSDRKVLEHFKLLEDIGVSFNPMKDEWMRQYSYFLDYYNKFGNLNIPISFKRKIDGEIISIGQLFRNQKEALTKRKEDILSGNCSLELLHRYYLLKDIGFDFSNKYDSIKYDFGDGEKLYNKKSISKRLGINVKLFSKYYTRFNGNVDKTIKVCNMINNLKEKDTSTLNDFLFEFDIDETTLRQYLDKSKVKSSNRSSEVIMYKDGVSLRKYCIDNGYNYGVIIRALRLKQKELVDDDLESIINRVISDYRLNGQNKPATWIYSKYGNELLLKHFLTSLELDSDSVLRDMTRNCISLDEAICNNCFKNINNKKYDYLEELYKLVCKRFNKLNHDPHINSEIAVLSITEYIESKIKEHGLTYLEYEVIVKSLFKYIEAINKYHLFDVAFEKDEKKKQDKIDKYVLDSEEIEESFYIPLEFDNKVLIGRDSELYKRRLILKELVHIWDNLNEDEKKNYIIKYNVTDDELKYVDTTRSNINIFTKKKEDY